MTHKIFNFISGLELKIDDEYITLVNNVHKSKLETKMYDSFSYNIYKESRISPAGLFFRTLFFSFISIFLIMFLSLEVVLIYSIIIAILNGLFVILFTLDAFLELNIFRNITNTYFSDSYYKIIIGSKSSNNINFFVSTDELEKIKEVEKFLNDSKKNIKDNVLKDNVKPPVVNFHEDLIKLGELLNSGLITQSEFDLMKKQILGF